MHHELTAYIIALFLETLLFGAFTVTYTMGASSLLTTIDSRRRSIRAWVLLGASTTMFGLALAHLALSLKLTLFGFVTSAGTIESVYDVLTGFTFVSPLWYIRLGIYVTQTLIGDSFMIYRLFLVCNRSRKAVGFPAMLFLLNLLCGYLALAPGPGFAFIPLSFFLFSFLCNAVCSALIMRHVLRNINQYTSLSARLQLFRKVVEAIVQSAAIYSTASFALGITLICSPAIGFDACIGVFSSLIGLVFSFIVLRLARSAAGDAARLDPHTQDRGADGCRDAIETCRPMSVLLHIPAFLPPTLQQSSVRFSNDVQLAESLVIIIKPAEVLLRNVPCFDDVNVSNLEGRLGEDDLNVLDKCVFLCSVRLQG
ncbi:hypothetical protein VTO73DRAFT_11941 [Trametes versicolor]